MWLHKTAADEERAVLVLPQVLDRAIGGMVIGMTLAVAIEHDDLVRMRCLRDILRERRLDVFRRRGAFAPRDHQPVAARAAVGLRDAAALGPRLHVIEAAMENLAGAQRDVSVFPEQLGQRHPIRVGGAEVCAVAEHAGGRRIPPGQQRRPRGIAEWVLAIVAVEADTRPGQRVDIGRDRAEAALVTAKFDPHVVGHDKKDVGPAGGRGAGLRAEGSSQRGGERGAGGLADELAAG